MITAERPISPVQIKTETDHPISAERRAAMERVKQAADYDQNVTDEVTYLADLGLEGPAIARLVRDQGVSIQTAYYALLVAGFDACPYALSEARAELLQVPAGTLALHVNKTREPVKYCLEASTPFALPRVIWMVGFEG